MDLASKTMGSPLHPLLAEHDNEAVGIPLVETAPQHANVYAMRVATGIQGTGAGMSRKVSLIRQDFGYNAWASRSALTAILPAFGNNVSGAPAARLLISPGRHL